MENHSIPAGAVAVQRELHNAIVQASGIEFFHGYTYSAHPVAAAAIRASLKLYREEGLFERGVLVRYTGDTLARSPPLIIEEGQIDQLMAAIRGALMEIE